MCSEGPLSKSQENSEINLREMYCELNALTRADGSVLLSQGETAVMASVYGPIDAKLQNVLIDRANVEVYYRSKVGTSFVTDRRFEQILRNTCESALLTMLYPRTAILVQLQEMENRAGLIACAINATCLALLNSGIPMKFLIAAIHCVVTNDGNLLLDPDQRQTDASRAQLTIVFDSVKQKVVALHSTGKFTVAQYSDALEMGRQTSENVFKFYKNAVKKFARVKDC